MRFRFLDALTLPGNPAKPNEDSFVQTERMAAVFDGATGLGERLMPGPSDAQWIAQFGARRLKAHAETGDAGPRDWLRAAAADAEKSYTALRFRPPRETYEIAFASLMFVSLAEDRLLALWLGDCAALIRAPSGQVSFIGETLERRGLERERAARLAKMVGAPPAAASVREHFLPSLRASRNRVNHGEEWLFAPDAACADHADEAEALVVAGSEVLVASDGFLALIADYERYSPETLIAAAKLNGLAALGEELRAIEAADPDGARYPRFKQSDDATALLLAIEG